MQFIRYSAYRLPLRNITQLLHTPSLSVTPEAQRRKKTPTLKGIVSVLSVAGADIRNQRVTPPSLIIELFHPTPTLFFFFLLDTRILHLPRIFCVR